MNVTPQQLSILRHSIGYDDAGNDRYPNARSLDERRNHYVSSDNGEDRKVCEHLVALGYMQSHGTPALACGPCFSVTDAGRAIVLEHKPVPPKLTRSQRRYRYYRECCECFDSFLHFLGWEQRRRAEGRPLNY